MARFLVDLHVHTLLSPCADLDMSPEVIVRRAVSAGLDAIAVCDHNTTLQIPVVRELAHSCGLAVFCGTELTTREEAHLVAILPGQEVAERLQEWIDAHIVRIPNRPEKLGDQMWVDRKERIAGEVPWYLNAPLECTAEQTAAEVMRLGGLVVPAHVDRTANSLIGQLGFLPPRFPAAAVEYNHADRFASLMHAHPELHGYTAYTASDAHFPDQIGINPSWLCAESRTFGELRKAFGRKEGRSIASVFSRL